MSFSQSILQNIQKEISKLSNSKHKKSFETFFKDEEIVLFGVPVPKVRKLSAKYFPKTLSKKEIFVLAESLLKEKYFEYSVIAFDWLWRVRRQFEPKDLIFFKKIVLHYIDNWAKCDDFGTKALGYFFLSFPREKPKLLQWAKSRNKWMRRISLVSLIPSVRRKNFNKENMAFAFSLCSLLYKDKDPKVLKACGWLLKEIGNNSPQNVLKFLSSYKDCPSLVRNYALEKIKKLSK